MPPELDVDLMVELGEETDILPTSLDRESDIDPRRPSPVLTPVGRVDIPQEDPSSAEGRDLVMIQKMLD